MTTERPPLIVRFERSLAQALAAAAATAPDAAGLALAAAAAAFQDVAWAAAAGFASGALLGRSDRRASYVVLGALAVWMLELTLHPRIAWYLGPVVHERNVLVAATAFAAHLFAAAPPPIVRAAVALFHLRTLRRLAAALVLFVPAGVAATLVAQVAALNDSAPGLLLAQIALGTGGILAALLAARRFDLSAVLVIALTAGQFAFLRHWVFRDSSSLAGTISSIVVLPACYLAGAFAADLVDGVRADGGTRLVVMCQRRAWLASLLLTFGIVGLTGPWAWKWYPVEDAYAGLSIVPLVPIAFAALAHVGRGGTSTVDRLAPWFAANLAGLALAVGLFVMPGWPVGFPQAVGLTLPFTIWPLVAGVVLPGNPPGDVTPIAATAFPVTIVIFPPLLAALLRSPEAWVIAAAVCLLLAPLAFHAAVRSRLPSARILLLAAIGGLAWSLLLPAADRHTRGAAPEIARHLIAPVCWLVAGVLVIAARRCRSMTAVPADHPLVTDWGRR